MSDTYVQRIVGKQASIVDYSLHLKLYDNISNSTEVCQSMAIFLNIILVKINYSLAHLQIWYSAYFGNFQKCYPCLRTQCVSRKKWNTKWDICNTRWMLLYGNALHTFLTVSQISSDILISCKLWLWVVIEIYLIIGVNATEVIPKWTPQLFFPFRHFFWRRCEHVWLEYFRRTWPGWQRIPW